MTIDEAIKFEESLVECACPYCAEKHRQVVIFLNNYRLLRNGYVNDTYENYLKGRDD